jgi:aminocarboxymuconate-semialdehyde decarboxylase
MIVDVHTQILHLKERLDNGYRACRPNDAYAPGLPSHYYRRLYYDTVSFHKPALTCAVLSVGAERLVMGSDYPHIIGDLARAVSSIQELEVSTADRGKILGETARRIFRF